MRIQKGVLSGEAFEPRRIASWWSTIDDLQWPQQNVIDRIKWRAEAFAEAGIDTAINFGFHMRFDFSNYFGTLHGYLAQVSNELKKYDIRFMDHYSCNTIERPRGEAGLRKLHSSQRHHVLLHPDPIAAKHAQYAGHRFQNLCEVDVRDGGRGFNSNYQAELFCHNNPSFLEMHASYLQRLISEVPLDAIEVDDMCDYGGFSTCCCKYCLERFRIVYGYELPHFGDTDFWGDTSGTPLTWGNYDNPVFRDWVRLKSDSVVEHLKMIKSIIGDLPLMTCCSSTGPITLNSIGLNLEKMSEHLDFFMLENCGLGVETINWSRMDAEALQQKDIAEKRGRAPAMAISYTNYHAGGYLGWALSRFWGVGNWSSTLHGRIPIDLKDGKEIEEIVGPLNNWELQNSNLDYREGRDVPEVRLVSNRYCKENGWRDNEGLEHWDRVMLWSKALLNRNIGYRFVRAEELADAEELLKERLPLVLDGVGCISDKQYESIKKYASAGGEIWIRLPFGTHDDLGYRREQPLSDDLLNSGYSGLVDISAYPVTEGLEKLIAQKVISPRIQQVNGDDRWTARFRRYRDDIVLHLMNRGLEAEEHPILFDGSSGSPILYDFKSISSSEKLVYKLDFAGLGRVWSSAMLTSPELGDIRREVGIEVLEESNKIQITIDPTGVELYSVLQPQS